MCHEQQLIIMPLKYSQKELAKTYRFSSLDGTARSTVNAFFQLHWRSDSGRRRCNIDSRHSQSSMKRFEIEILHSNACISPTFKPSVNAYSCKITVDGRLRHSISTSNPVNDITISFPPSHVLRSECSQVHAEGDSELLPGEVQCIKLREISSICKSETITFTMNICISE